MASDRRFGLPHPFDSDPSGESSAGRKPGLWETLKRALASTSPTVEPPAAPPLIRDAPEPRAPAAPPRPAAPAATLHSPTPPPAAPPRVEPAFVEVAAGVPFLDDLPAASPSPVQAPPATPSVPIPAVEIAPARAPESASEVPRLARGLASFSRDNAEREKKFAHLLRDSTSEDAPRPPGSRKRR